MQHKFGTPNAPTPQRPLAVQARTTTGLVLQRGYTTVLCASQGHSQVLGPTAAQALYHICARTYLRLATSAPGPSDWLSHSGLTPHLHRD